MQFRNCIFGLYAVIPAQAGIYKKNYRRELVSGFRRKDKPKPKKETTLV
jgi:hypothetical protein